MPLVRDLPARARCGSGRLEHQILALIDGLRLQWLSDPEHVDLVAQWRKAATLLFPARPCAAPLDAGEGAP